MFRTPWKKFNNSITFLSENYSINEYVSRKKELTQIKGISFFKDSFWKPWDIVILFSLVLMSIFPLVIFSINNSSISQSADTQAVIRVDGKEVQHFDLIKGNESFTYRYVDSDGDYNLIEISGNKIRIKEASCTDQTCVKQGWISNESETIVCLPHKLVIEITNTST